MDTDFIGYGTPVEQVGEDESLSKLANENKLKAQKVRDKQGRERFHGAFTGGFSAGYYNTVGTEEGWVPSTFSSSRQKRGKKDEAQRGKVSTNYSMPEHYMDEEDLEQFGIAPRQIQTSSDYGQSDQPRERAAWDPIVPGMTKALTDVIKPVHMSVAVKLLQLMGWKHGQGIGPREKRKRAHQISSRPVVVRPSLPHHLDQEESSDEDEYISKVTFAPKDMNPVDFRAKDDLHGIGYQPLNIKTHSRSSAVEEERLTFGGHTQGISGKAFGVGIEEDEDDVDIYSKDQMSSYDMSLGDEPEDLHSFTKPSGNRKHGKGPSIYQSSTVLEGFCLAQRKDNSMEKYLVPELPRGYRPKAAVTGVSELPKLYGKLDNTLRALIIGESVQDAGLLKSEQTKSSPLLPGKSADLSLNEDSTTIAQEYETEVPLVPPRATEPLNKQSVDFKPFVKHPEKQARYERYLMLKRSGDRDAYDKVAPPEYRRHEKDREREEFERSGKFFKDLTGVMASRFTRSKQTEEDDDSKVSVRVDEEADGLLDDKKQAVKMKMFGKLTRESYEWHPHRLLCRRFNIPDPYPDSRLVGLPTVYKDKISAYNFLDLDSLTKTPSDLKAKNEKEKQAEFDKELELDQTTSGPKSLADGEKAPIDLFKAVFQDSDDSGSSDDDSDEEPEPAISEPVISEPKTMSQETASTAKSSFQSLKEQYGQSRAVPSMYTDDPTHISKLPTSDTPLPDINSDFKVKFVPKSDRYKSDVVTKKSRWSKNGTENDSTQPNISTDSLPEPTSIQGESVISVKEEAVSEAVKEPGTPPSPEIHTPPSADTDEDSWMPALPPSFVGPPPSEPTNSNEAASSSKHKKSKGKEKHKHKKSKSKKSHKERRKR